MKFEEVLPALREGKKIRLKEWKEIEYIYMPKNETNLKAEDYHSVNLSWQDLFSGDWEIVKEKKKIKLRDLTEEQYEKWVKNNCGKTLCKDCPFFKVMCCVKNRCWVENKDLYSDKFLDQEIEIEDEPILAVEEKIYLRKIIEPYRDKVESIEKFGSEYLDSDNDFIVIHLEEDSISLPILNTSFKFNGMELNKQYTLKELRL